MTNLRYNDQTRLFWARVVTFAVWATFGFGLALVLLFWLVQFVLLVDLVFGNQPIEFGPAIHFQ